MESSSGGPNLGDVKILQSKQLPADQDKKKQQKQLILLAILIPIFIYVVYANILAPKGKAVPAGPKTNDANTGAALTPQPSTTEVISNTGEEKSSGLDALLKEDDWDRNPFTLGGYEEEEEETSDVLRLDGIVFDGADSYAIINKKIVKQGDRIADKEVREVRESEVLLRSDDGSFIKLKS